MTSRDETRPHGLGSDEAAARLARYGPNALPEPPRPSMWRRFAAQFASPIIYILLVALAFEVGVWLTGVHEGFPLEAVAIAVILLANAALGVWQERKAESALARLAEMGAPRVAVVRDGRLVDLPASALVPGDVVRLEAGDRVPADGRLRTPRMLAIDESIVTGESIPVDKVDGDGALSGSLVTTGSAWLDVEATGVESTMGRLAVMLGGVATEPTPLERRLTEFGHRVARWVLALAGAIALAGLYMEGLGRAAHVLVFAVALAVAAVPEGLPAILTVTLALGVERMAARRAVVRKLAAVEALGSVTVVATDKTGTLTENRLEVRGLDVVDADAAADAMALANEAEAGGMLGDPVDRALLDWVEGHGGGVAARRAGFARTVVRPFDATWKYAAITGERGGARVTWVKGAPEVVLARASLDDAARAEWAARIDRHANDGFRLLALARTTGPEEGPLDWIGLVLLWDPPRPEVPDAIRTARAAGIRVLMITGDHPGTAATVAAAVGMERGPVLTGDELDRLSDAELARALATVPLYARVKPEHKLRIVSALKAAGEIVAVTGDGVNDAPALKRADVGVAMGQRGSDVSREVADLVLLDDDFATIVAAIEEGRSIYENIQKFVRFLFSTNFSEVLVVALGMVTAFALELREASGALLLPLTAAQLLWINLVTDGAPALALGVDANPGVMRRGPLPPAAPLLDRRSLEFVLVSGAAKALLALGLLGLLPALVGESAPATRTVTFTFMAVGQLVFAYPARRTDLVPPPNRWLHLAVGVGVVAQVVVLAVPVLRRAFDATLPSWPSVGVLVAALVAVYALAEGVRRAVWRRA